MINPRKIALGTVLVLAAVAAGVAVNLWHQKAAVVPISDPVSVPSESGSGVVPTTLPTFSLHDREGRLRSIQEWQGKSLVINFWATWCPPCLREIPLLKAVHADRAFQGFQVIGIAVDFRDAVLAYAKKAGIDYPVLIGEQDGMDAAAAFGAASTGLPFTVFTDNRGRIVTLNTGELNAEEAGRILDAVAAINAGTLPIEQARNAILQKPMAQKKVPIGGQL